MGACSGQRRENGRGLAFWGMSTGVAAPTSPTIVGTATLGAAFAYGSYGAAHDGMVCGQAICALGKWVSRFCCTCRA